MGGETGNMATASDLQETNVRQIVRHAILKGIFVEPRGGIVAHNAVSRLVAQDQAIHDLGAA